jgi:ATP-dependent DNA helicase RecG
MRLARPTEESLTVEFKSDRQRLFDRDLVEAVVCLANAEGGSIFLGIEDDGTATGLRPERTSVEHLPAMIANRTSPPVLVDASTFSEQGLLLAHLRVPKAAHVVATTEGVMKRRRIGADGRPECVPLLPSEIPSRLSELGVLDVSRQAVPGAALEDLDPAERARLRQFVERFRGDQDLLVLSDDELDGALGLVTRAEGQRLPSLVGLLLIGRESALQRLVPTHEVAFQVLEGEDVRVNEFSRAPLLRVIEWLETLLTPLNTEQEMQAGLFRVPVPRVDKRAFREGIANALCHRDYARVGATHVRFESDALVISNVGGFVEGVTIDNLLITEPRPRNPALADALKRIGVVERTGRGVDAIYRGLLHYGRPRPDYTRSTRTSVVLRMAANAADLGFLRLVLEAEEKRGARLPIDSLIALSCLRDQRRVTADELSRAIQKDRGAAKQTLEALVESGLAEPHGHTNNRSYTLAARVYATLGQHAAYTRQAGFDAIQHEQMVLNYVRQHRSIQRPDVVELCHLTEDQATRLLRRLVDSGRLRPEGEKRWRRYVLAGEGDA